MSTGRTVPPAYLSYRVLLIVVVLALLTAAGFAVAGDATAIWQTASSWVRDIRQSWTDLGWQVV